MKIKISDREREVVLLASRGVTDKGIAAELGISARTVGTYWERLREKTAGTSRTQIVMEIIGKELEAAMNEAIEARVELDILLEQAEGYAVFGIALDGKLLDWNLGVSRVLGFAKEDFVGQDFAIVFTPDDVERGEPKFELDQAQKFGRYIENRYHVRNDGTRVWVAGTLVAIRNEDGSIRKFSKIMRDDTQRKSMEEQIQRLQGIPVQT